MPKVFLCYHTDDPDGWASAAIAYKYAFDKIVDNNYKDIITVPMSYGQPFDFSQIDMNNDLVIFVDFVLQPFNQMLMFDQENLIVIDHHKTTIENLTKNPEFKPGGVIGDIENLQSAAELAWKFFYPDIPLPLFVQYISWYDVWRKDLPDWEEHILPFNEGLKTLLGNFESNKSSWLDLIDWSGASVGSEEALAYANFMSDCLRFGRHIMKHKIDSNNEIIKKNSFVTEFEGHKTLALNANIPNFMTSSPTWLTGEFDIALCFVYIGDNQNSWTCHLRTDKKEIDLEEIAKKHHGGGHKSSAGAQFKKLPFKLRK